MLHDGYILAGLACAAAGFSVAVYLLVIEPLREERRRCREFNCEWGGMSR